MWILCGKHRAKTLVVASACNGHKGPCNFKFKFSHTFLSSLAYAFLTQFSPGTRVNSNEEQARLTWQLGNKDKVCVISWCYCCVIYCSVCGMKFNHARTSKQFSPSLNCAGCNFCQRTTAEFRNSSNNCLPTNGDWGSLFAVRNRSLDIIYHLMMALMNWWTPLLWRPPHSTDIS